MDVTSLVQADGSVRLGIKSERGQHGGIEFELGKEEWEHFVRYVLSIKPVYPHPMSHTQRGTMTQWDRMVPKIFEEYEQDFVEVGETEEVPFRHNMTEGYGDDPHVA